MTYPGRYDITVDVGLSYAPRCDATVSVLTNLLNGMLPQDPMRVVVQGVILDNNGWRRTRRV